MGRAAELLHLLWAASEAEQYADLIYDLPWPPLANLQYLKIRSGLNLQHSQIRGRALSDDTVCNF